MDGPDGYELIQRRMCLIKDTGHAGVLWGGTMMGWVDEAGALMAGLVTKNVATVTKAYTEFDFKQQVRPGDMVEFWGRVERWGTTSLSLKIKVRAAKHGTRLWRDVLDVTAVFVAITPAGKKTRVLRA